MQDFYTINKTLEFHIKIQHQSTNELIYSTSQCHPTCFNNEISTCCLVMFVWSRRCYKSINEYTYDMDRQNIVYILHKPMGSIINTVYQHENESFLQRILQLQITLQEQSVQTDAKWIYFDRFFKERRRRCQNQLIWNNICLTVCLYTIFIRNKRGLLKTHFFLKLWLLKIHLISHDAVTWSLTPVASFRLFACLCCVSCRRFAIANSKHLQQSHSHFE